MNIWKSILFLTSICYLSTHLLAQDPYHYRVDNGTHRTHGMLIHEIDDAYLCIGQELYKEMPFNIGVFAYEIDKYTGEQTHFTFHDIDSTIIFFGYVNNSYRIEDKIYYITKSVNKIFLTSYDIISKTSAIEDVILPNIPSQTIFIGDFSISDHKLYIYTSTQHESNDKDRYVYIYDLLTKEVAYILLENPSTNAYAGKQYLYENGDLALFGHMENNRLLFQKIDSNGEVIWEYKSALNKKYFRVHAALQISADEFLISCSQKKIQSNQNKYNPILLKFNTDTQKIVWESNVQYDTYWTSVGDYRNIIPSFQKDGYLFSGSNFELFFEQDSLLEVGVVGKITADGDLLWKRKYYFLSESGDRHIINDMMATSDSSYVCFGTATHYRKPDDTDYWNQSWVFKIDEQGHIIGDTVNAIEWIKEELTDQIQLFPNPAHDVLYINQDEIQNISYYVYDLNGTKIDQVILSQSNHSVTWDIHDWHPGNYIIQIFQKNKPLGSMKLIKQ